MKKKHYKKKKKKEQKEKKEKKEKEKKGGRSTFYFFAKLFLFLLQFSLQTVLPQEEQRFPKGTYVSAFAIKKPQKKKKAFKTFIMEFKEIWEEVIDDDTALNVLGKTVEVCLHI